MQKKDVKCEGDEYPPAAFQQGARWPKQYIRFSPGGQNGGAGSLFKLKFCGFDDSGNLPVEKSDLRFTSTRIVGGLERDVSVYFAKTIRSAVEINFDANVVDPDGIAGLYDNLCWPKVLLEDPGFALLTDDPYYRGAGREDARAYVVNYPEPIPADVLLNNQAQAGYRKRSEKSHGLDPDAWVYDDGNSTRRLTDKELEEEMGILRCSSANCEEEMQALGIETAVVTQPEVTGPPQVPTAIPTTTQQPVVAEVTAPMVTPSAGGGTREMLWQPRATGV